MNEEILNSPRVKRPDWLKVKIKVDDDFNATKRLMTNQSLHTVCEEARCPNIYECWSRNTATIMILGDTCTRSCGFCSVKTGRPLDIDVLEPFRTAQAVKKMNLKHVVITSVDRDDLTNDYGAEIWADTIIQIHSTVPNCNVEVLTPDFRGYIPALKKVFNAKPEIFSHNIECVERISKAVRKHSDWDRSKEVLRLSIDHKLTTKTGMMVGLGETDFEVFETMKEIADLGVEIFNVGQYLQPTKKHLEVQRFVHPDVFKRYKEKGLELGFKVVESGPLVRSSYHADEQARKHSS
jgi:lipoic acid synthetase|tara:strand:+ start:35 stop:916 length:882 start_codon:yes stop_codon:yes gene_type:complete